MTKDVILSTGFGDYTIPGGVNWDCWSLANYLNKLFEDDNLQLTITPDMLRLKYIFSDKITVYAASTCQTILGLEAGVNYEDLTVCPKTFCLAGMREIRVFGSLCVSTYVSSHHRISACSDMLCSIPVRVLFGDEIYYVDESDTKVLLYDFEPSYIVIHFESPDGDVLEPEHDWSISLELSDSNEVGYGVLAENYGVL